MTTTPQLLNLGSRVIANAMACLRSPSVALRSKQQRAVDHQIQFKELVIISLLQTESSGASK